jgi:multidrug resistance efflux pump
MRNEVLAQFNYSTITVHFLSGDQYLRERRRYGHPGMPLVSIEGASKLEVSAMVSETDITSIKKGMPVSILVKSSNENLRVKRGEFIGKTRVDNIW